MKDECQLIIDDVFNGLDVMVCGSGTFSGNCVTNEESIRIKLLLNAHCFRLYVSNNNTYRHHRNEAVFVGPVFL